MIELSINRSLILLHYPINNILISCTWKWSKLLGLDFTRFFYIVITEGLQERSGKWFYHFQKDNVILLIVTFIYWEWPDKILMFHLR